MYGFIRKTQCPECGSDEIDVEGFRTVGTESFDVYICNNCGQIWDDSGIDDFD